MQAPALEPLHWVLPFEWAKDIDRAQIGAREIVSGVLTEGGLSMFYGDSNSGKTYMVMHLGLCIASGLPWLGCQVERGLVIYIACESAVSIRRRYVAHCKHFGLEEVSGFGIVPTTISLMDPSADIDAVISLVKEQMFAMGEAVQLIVIDTVARAMAGGNENDGEDVSRLVGGADRIREETGAHVLLIHHTGKESTKGARGHSSLRAAVDTEIEVTSDDSNIHVAKVTKQRDLATKGQRFAARFVSVELGIDQWGKPTTACALEDVDSSEVPQPKGKALTRGEIAVLSFLAGQDKGVRKPDIVLALEPQGIRRASVYTAINSLLKVGQVTDTMGLIYRPKES